MRLLLIGVAGALGAVSRYQVEGWVGRRAAGGAFPWGTFVVNVTGSFALGLFATLLTERFLANVHMRSALTIGFLGAYTTFSTFAYEAVRLGDEGAGWLAIANVVLSVCLGLVAVWAGMTIGRAL